MPFLMIMHPGVCTIGLFADYVKTLTFDNHVASFTNLVDCKYKVKVHRQQ